MTIEFQLELYYQMYKETPIVNREDFRKKFIKKHGKFQYLPELIFMIEKYQVKKYGNLIDDFITINTKKGR